MPDTEVVVPNNEIADPPPDPAETTVVPEPVAPTPPPMPEDNGPFQKDPSGGWFVKIDLQDGSGAQIFKGSTQKDVAAQLVEAQKNATRKIRQQQRQLKLGSGALTPDPAVALPDYTPRELTKDERWQIAQDLQDPSKADTAMERLLTAKLGATPDEIRRNLRESAEAAAMQKATAIAASWAALHPEFYGTPANYEAMLQYFTKNKLAVTERNFDIAFQDLSDSGLLETAPVAEPTPLPEPVPAPVARRDSPTPVPVTRTRPAPPASLSNRGTGTPAASQAAGPAMPTAEEIRNMPASEYGRRLRDSQFRAYVEKLLAEGKLR